MNNLKKVECRDCVGAGCFKCNDTGINVDEVVEVINELEKSISATKDEIALRILCSLLSNSERYKYIASKIDNNELTNCEATQKNIDKSYMIADQFLATN